MSSPISRRARLVKVDQHLVAASSMLRADYRSAFEVEVSTQTGSPEQWARNVFEGAPVGLRWSLLLGWKVVLGLGLGPLGSPDHVLGWAIQKTSPTSITVAAHSATLSAQKVVHLDGDRLVIATFVRFDRRWSRLLWSAVLPVHRRLEPALLTYAASQAPN